MNHMFQGTRLLRAVGMTLVLALLVCVPAFAQQPGEVSGTVTSAAAGTPIQGVTVRVRGSGSNTVTDAQGKYSLAAPPDAVLVFSLIGYRGTAQSVGGRSTINLTLEQAISVLPDVVVTGYQEQLRRDLPTAASAVDVGSIDRQSGASALQRLDGRVAGVTVDNGGSPGSRTTVRIRGVSSFQNNDPLYVVDGTPVQDTYLNWLNPNDIASMEVLKDATAASIYGSRANNGVILIETKRGRPGHRKVTLDVTSGVATPVNGYDNMLITNSLDYFQVVKTAFQNGGQAVPKNIYGDVNNPTVPDYIWPNNNKGQSCRAADSTSTCSLVVDPASYALTSDGTKLIMPGSPGTNWWKAVFGSGQVRNANLAVSGGGEDNAYNVSFNYLNQQGTAAYNRFQRGGVRVNTTFNLNRVNIGENLSISREQGYGGLDDNGLGEGNIVGKNIFQQPVVPVYDIAGYFASGKAVGLSNLTNPLKIAFSGQNNINTNGTVSALLSFFGKADYNYAERYFLSLTVRRDGSSRLGPTHRWGTFPAVAVGWRLSNEPFFPSGGFFNNAMLRFGYGVTGNQQIPPDRIVSQLGGDRGDTFYDIGGGSKTTITPGFKFTALGNTELKWEENRSANAGLDLEFNQSRGSFSVDVYQRNSNNLLFDPRTPATAGSAAPPIVNIGKM